MMCEKCGQKVRKTDKFCMECGTKLTPHHTKQFLEENQSISDIEIVDDVITITIYNKNNGNSYETKRRVGIAKREEIKEWVIKQSIPSKIPILLEKLGINKEEKDYMKEIEEITTIIGNQIMCNKNNINIVKAILYENNVKVKREDKVNDTTIIYL